MGVITITRLVKYACYFCVIVLLSEQCSSNQHFCGKALPDVLDSLCVNGYNAKIKKSMDLDDYAYNEVEDDLPYPYANSPFLNKIHGGNANLMAKTRRRRHGVYDECCRKGCSYQELLSYCLN